MKRIFAIVLVILMIFSACVVVNADVVSKDTKTDNRITAYTAHLKRLFDKGGLKGRITHVGIADLSKDYQPELFYITKAKSSMKSTFHVCGYDGDDVFDYEIDTNYIGYGPGSITLKRKISRLSGDYRWVIYSVGKNASGRKEELHNVFTRSGDTMNNEMKFRLTWSTGKTKAYRYSIDGIETVKSTYDTAIDKFYNEFQPASTSHYKNEGVVKKVANRKKRASVVNALNAAASGWKALTPVTK